MELRLLQYFLAVAREESITKAAEVLHVTQPTLSRQMMELEAELGTTLFHRTNRKTVLTEDGLRLRQRAEEIVLLVEKAKAEMGAHDEELSGDVYIGGGETEGMRTVARTIRRVQEQYPNIRFHMFSGDGYDVTERLDRGLIDFGTLIEPIDLHKYDSLRLPRPDVWGLLLRKDHPLAKQEAIRPEDLKGVPLLFSRQLMGENGLSGWLGYDYKTLNVVSTGNLVNNQRLLVEEGVGSAVTLDEIVNLTGDSALCFRPFSPKMESWMYIAWKKHQLFSRAAEVFLDALRQEME